MPVWITAILQLLCGLLGYANKRMELNNAPDVRRAEEAQQEVNQVSKVEKVVEEKDVNEIRKELAE